MRKACFVVDAHGIDMHGTIRIDLAFSSFTHPVGYSLDYLPRLNLFSHAKASGEAFSEDS